MSKEVKDPKKSSEVLSYVDDDRIDPRAAYSSFEIASSDRNAFGGAASRRAPTPFAPTIQPAEAGGDSKVEDSQSLEKFQNQIKELTDKFTKLTEAVNFKLSQNVLPKDLASLKETLDSHNKEIKLLQEEATQQDTLINSIQPQLNRQSTLLGKIYDQVNGKIDLLQEQIVSLQEQIHIHQDTLKRYNDISVNSAKKIDNLAGMVSDVKNLNAKDDTISSQSKPLSSSASNSSASKVPQSDEPNLSASQASQQSRADRLKLSATKALEFLGLRTPPPAKTHGTYFSSRKPQENLQSPNPPLSNPQSPNPTEALQNSSQKEYHIAKVEKKNSYYFRTRNVEFIIPFDNIKEEFNYDDYDNRKLFADELKGLFIKFSEQNNPSEQITDNILKQNFKDFFEFHKFKSDFTNTHFKHNQSQVNSPEDIREFIKFFIALKSKIDKNQDPTNLSNDDSTRPSSSPSASCSELKLFASNSSSSPYHR